MNEDTITKKNNNDIVWIGIGVLGTMAICLLVAAVVIASLLNVRSRTSAVSDTTDLVAESRLAEETLLLLSSVEVPIADPPAFAERLLGLDGVPMIVSEAPLNLEPGSQDTFWITDTENNSTNSVEAELVFVSDHVYFWIEKDLSYELEEVKGVVEDFEVSTYPLVRQMIGHEWSPGVDGDPHIYILYVRGIGSSIAGMFYSRDEYSSLAQEFSNEHEIFYLNADTVSLSDVYLRGVLVHEFQHMVHWNLDRNEETWMTEGFSELAELLLGYEVGGFDYVFTHDTDIPLLLWPSESGSTGEHYGQTFLFMTYLYDRFGVEAIRMIAQNPDNGLRAIEEMLAEIESNDALTGRPLTIDDVFLDWGVSLALQDPDLADGRYGLQTYKNAPQAQFSESFNDCPLEEQSLQVSQFGIDLIHIDCQGEFQLLFSGEPLSKVISGNPKSGDFAFWSNRGDESNMMLTRSFDFRDTSGPIRFDYWVWYHIEEDYDYVYLEASTNGGETWQILTTPSGSIDDPSGNSYGWAYNGVSGNGNSPTWIKESVDISSFAGREVMFRFEYITDAAVNTEGFLLDDLTIDSIEYKEDFERGSGGWTGDGFVRIHNLVPQVYKLAIIERGVDVRIRKIEIDSKGRANIPLSFEGEVEDVILVVTGTSRYSWVSASYSIEIVK
jgi:hypothetical protein